MTANFANEPTQPIRLKLWIGGRLQPLRLTATVWGAHTRPGGVRAGRATHGGREYPVTWSAAEGAWLFVETAMQYDPNEVGEWAAAPLSSNANVLAANRFYNAFGAGESCYFDSGFMLMLRENNFEQNAGRRLTALGMFSVHITENWFKLAPENRQVLAVSAMIGAAGE